MSNDLDEQDTREDVRRIAAASESFADSEKKLVDFLARTDEDIRAQRHHDVFCLVLQELLQHDSKLLLKLPESDGLIHRSDVFRADLVDMAIKVADTAYPPPKAEP